MIDLRSGAQQYMSPYMPSVPAQMARSTANAAVRTGGTAVQPCPQGCADRGGNGGAAQSGWNGSAAQNGWNGSAAQSGWNGNGADGMETELAPYAAEHEHSAEEENGLTSMPQDDFNDHLTADEAARNSWRALLARNVGRNVIVSFLLGTQNTVIAEGELYEVGTDYLVIYQPAWESHITADLYSVKFVEFREPPSDRR